MSIKLGSTAFPDMPRQTESLMVLSLHAKVATLSFLFMTVLDRQRVKFGLLILVAHTVMKLGLFITPTIGRYKAHTV